MGTFYADVIQNHPLFDSPNPVRSFDLIEPETRRRIEAVIAEAQSLGLDLMVYETYRSRQRQALLFDRGATKLRTVGVHHYGLACDIVKSVNGEPSWKGDFSLLGKLAKKYGLLWGGDWGMPASPNRFVDAVHVQRCTVARQKQLFAETWYPDTNYDPYDEL